MGSAEFEERLFLGGRKGFVVQDKNNVFPKFSEGTLGRLGGEFPVELLPARGIKQLDPRFAKIPRRFLQPETKQLGERITRLILQRQLLLPPKQQLAKMFLDQLVCRVGLRIETKALVRVGRVIKAPAIPFPRVVRQRQREAYHLLEHLRPRSIDPGRYSRDPARPRSSRSCVRSRQRRGSRRLQPRPPAPGWHCIRKSVLPASLWGERGAARHR